MLWAVLTSRDRYALDRFSRRMPAQANESFDGMCEQEIVYTRKQ
jgi:hypothetical protein